MKTVQMPTFTATAITLVALVAAAGAPLVAQSSASEPGAAPETVDTRRIFVGAGPSFAQAGTSVGGATGSKAGLGFGGTIARVKPSGYRSLSLDVQYEPFEVQNPQRDERFSSVSFVVSGYLGPLGLGLGWQQRLWSGGDIWVESDGWIALQVTLAAPVGAWRGWGLAPELFLRLAGGDEISTSSFGARVMVGRFLR